jgi:hypothetical protein
MSVAIPGFPLPKLDTAQACGAGVYVYATEP